MIDLVEKKTKGKAKYLSRYKRIGQKNAKRTCRSDIGQPVTLNIDDTYNVYIPVLGTKQLQELTGRTYDHSLGSKPNHAARAADVTDCFPLIKAGHQ